MTNQLNNNQNSTFVTIDEPMLTHHYQQKTIVTLRFTLTLPTKVHLVKAMVFPVVMYGFESWTVKKAEHQRIDAFELQ